MGQVGIFFCKWAHSWGDSPAGRASAGISLAKGEPLQRMTLSQSGVGS